MNASDQIINCQTCQAYAKKLGGKEWQELFNTAWLRIREAEIKDPEKVIKDHKSYFYGALRNAMINQGKFNHRFADPKPEILSIEMDESNDVWDVEINILYKWLSQPAKDEHELFLQNIVTLAIKCKNKKKVIEQTGMSKRTFFRYLDEAKQEIEYAHFITIDRHPLSISDLVRRT